MLKLNLFLFAILFILIIFVYYKLYIYKTKEHMLPTTELDKVVQPVKYDITELEKVFVKTCPEFLNCSKLGVPQLIYAMVCSPSGNRRQRQRISGFVFH